MEIFGGLMMGLIGSLHCLGMCGPIALAVPPRNESKLSIIADSILYNIGRTLTYVLMGALVGLLGSAISLAGYQEILSIVAGVGLLIVVLIPKNWESAIANIPVFKSASDWFKKGFAKILSKKSLGSMFFLGNLNGLLPCGLVYMALGGAIASGSVVGSATFMLFFGIGTIPMMASVFILKSMIPMDIRRKINKLIPAGVAIVAIVLILRGLSLGIPYVSPVLPDKVQEKAKCCHSQE